MRILIPIWWQALYQGQRARRAASANHLSRRGDGRLYERCLPIPLPLALRTRKTCLDGQYLRAAILDGDRFQAHS